MEPVSVSTLATVITAIAAWQGIVIAFKAARKDSRMAKADAAVTIVDNATSFNTQLLERVNALEERIKEMELEMAQVKAEALAAQREAAEWKARYEVERERRLALELEVEYLRNPDSK